MCETCLGRIRLHLLSTYTTPSKLESVRIYLCFFMKHTDDDASSGRVKMMFTCHFKKAVAKASILIFLLMIYVGISWILNLSSSLASWVDLCYSTCIWKCCGAMTCAYPNWLYKGRELGCCTVHCTGRSRMISLDRGNLKSKEYKHI